MSPSSNWSYSICLSVLFACSRVVEGSGGSIPRRANDVQYREQKSALVHKTSSIVKQAEERKHRNNDLNQGRRLFGRHVCSQNKVTMVPVKDIQSYCKPTYQSYLRRCDKGNARYCSGYRVVYELSYRAIQRMAAKTESLHSCCPGWSQVRVSSTDCKKAICTEECRNGGSCNKPDQCSCSPGWTGKTCTTDIDECSEGKDQCAHDCTNTQGSHKCTCRTGYVLQADGRKCEKDSSVIENEVSEEITEKMEDLQKRLEALEEWQVRLSEVDKEHSRHEREYRINSLSEQIALLEEKLAECSCHRRDDLTFPRSQK